VSRADVDALVARAESVLASDGSIALAELGPKPLRADVARALAARGFDVGKSKIERPATDRVRALLADGAFLPIAAIKARTGLSPARTKEVVAELVASGEARVVLRTAKETLVPARSQTVDARELAAIGRALTELAKTCVTATKKGAGLLREDVDAALARIRELTPEARRSVPPTRGSSAPGARPIEDAIRAVADASTGLAFVPAVVDALAPRPARDVHAELLRAAGAGRIELRPEGGMARLSPAERAACVPGPDGGVLSWTRVVGGPA